MTKVFAHRGASAYAPENTLPAFELADRMGADGIELDVQLTKDGEPVVIHDEGIDRVSTGTGLVRNLTLRELRRFSFHNRMGTYIGVQIPTLREVLEMVKPTAMDVNIELKTGIYRYPGLEEKVHALVQELGMQKRIIYSSFNQYSIARMKELDPTVEAAWLFSDVILDVDAYAKQHGVEGLHPAVYHLQMPGLMKQWQESGEKIRVWTVNRREDMRWFIQNRLEAVITNYPDIALSVREEVEGTASGRDVTC